MSGNRVKAKNPAYLRGVRILHEDGAVIVVEKPAGMLTTHTRLVGRAERESQLTVENVLNNYVRKGQLKSTKRVWLVHRLDRETSGVMMFAKTEAAAETMRSHWGEMTEKSYLALVEGSVGGVSGTLEDFLKEDADGFRVRCVPPETPGAKRAITAWRVCEDAETTAFAKRLGFGCAGGRATLVEATLHTGRKNQIRVQFARAGHPVAGDVKYGGHKASRLCLHSWKLSFTHPVTGRRFSFRSIP